MNGPLGGCVASPNDDRLATTGSQIVSHTIPTVLQRRYPTDFDI
jgi:hypothetical protein